MPAVPAPRTSMATRSKAVNGNAAPAPTKTASGVSSSVQVAAPGTVMAGRSVPPEPRSRLVVQRGAGALSILLAQLMGQDHTRAAASRCARTGALFPTTEIRVGIDRWIHERSPHTWRQSWRQSHRLWNSLGSWTEPVQPAARVSLAVEWPCIPSETSQNVLEMAGARVRHPPGIGASRSHVPSDMLFRRNLPGRRPTTALGATRTFAHGPAGAGETATGGRS